MNTTQMTRKLAWRFFAGFATVLAWTVSGAAQTVVVGTGDPDTDVVAVQAAVDQGGNVVLKGRFSFNKPPTVPTFVGGLATVVVWKPVEISGTQDDEMASIEGGTTPFYVDAPGASVSIRGLRFILPKGDAIFVYAVSGLVIASCKIEGIVPLSGLGHGVSITTSGNIPNPTNPGKPENVSGTIRVVNNDIDVAGGTAFDNTLGVTVFSVGQSPDKEVDVYVSGNHIRNTTEPAIDFRRIAGRAHVERNVIATGRASSQINPGPEVIRVVNIGSYLIAHNSIDCRWADAAAKGIGVFSQFATWPIEHALIVDNDVNMDAPEGTVFTSGSAGIDIRGFAQSNLVFNNRIHGSARAALSVDVFKGGIPDNNAFVLNRFDDFAASLADVFVDTGVTNTRIVGAGTIVDHGIGTVIVPVPF